MKALIMVSILVGWTGTAAAQSGNRALYFTGEGGYSTNYSGLTSSLVSPGAAGADTNTTTLSGANLANYRIVFLMVNTGLSAGSRTTLQNFHAAGGTIVGVADGRGFRDAAPAFNPLTQALGFGSMFTSTELDSGCSHNATPSVHPLTAGVSSFRYAYGSDVNGGDIVLTGISMDVVRATTRFVAIGDSNAISEDCGASPAGNRAFYANLWTFASSAVTCGNGVVEAGEQCDDGNSVNTDTCLANCRLATCGDGFIQTGVEMCDDGNASDTDACPTTCVPAACGDGFVQTGVEMCDDGNAIDTDACPSTCESAVCGDGFVFTGMEACDDGNAIDTDACLTTCVAASCGDGFLYDGMEACDDGNAMDTDACPSTCVPASCGDGFLYDGMEACDDGNTADTDACLSTCVVASCGDGFVRDGVETCDDGNTANTDACVGECVAAACGDGFVQGGIETCDDGNTVETDACRNNCSLASCGDGVVAAGTETCDGGGETAQCNDNCTVAACGDGIINEAAGEECDGGDECAVDCTLPAASGGGCCQAGGTSHREGLFWLLVAMIALRPRRRRR